MSLAPLVVDLFTLKDRVALITGGAGLLGVQHAEVIAAAGGIPILLDLDEARADAAAQKLAAQFHVDAWGAAVDITDQTALHAFLARVLQRHGRIDILIANVELWMTRMHSSKGSFGSFVQGWNCLPAWGTVVLPELQQHLEATQVQRPPTYRHGDGTYSGLHQNDLVSNRAAADFLREKAGEWYATEHPRPSFAVDLTDMTKFRWFNFLTEKRWCTVDKAEVEAFWLVWHENEPCFLLRMRTGECWVVQHCGSERGPKLIQIQEQEVSFA